MRAILAAAVLGLATSPPVLAEVKDASRAGFTIENTAIVPTDPASSWRALVEDVGQWWPADHTWWGDASKLSITPRAGGCFCEIDGPRQAEHMRIAFVDPPNTLRLLGGLGPLQGMGLDGVLEFRLTPDAAGGTRIVLFFRAGGYSPDDIGAFAPTVDRVQAQQLGGLAQLLRGAVAPPQAAE